MTGQQLLQRAWFWYAQAVGVTAIAAAISYGVIAAFSRQGPVVDVVKEASLITRKVPYEGVLRYRLATRRLKLCEGSLIYTFRRREVVTVSVVLTRPVTAPQMSPATDTIVHIQLPESIYPGIWRDQVNC